VSSMEEGNSTLYVWQKIRRQVVCDKCFLFLLAADMDRGQGLPVAKLAQRSLLSVI
jgi:hypothetical protein